MTARRLALAAGLALAAAASSPAFAAADFLTAPKIECLPLSITQCNGGRCTTRPAAPKDKADTLVIDFAAKKATLRRGTEAKPFADIVDEEVSGGERRFAFADGRPGKGERMPARLSKSGKLHLVIGTDGGKGEATCKAAS